MYQKIKNEIKEAMKSKDSVKRDVLKMVVDKARNIVKIQNPSNVTDDISNEVIIQAVEKEIKQLNQTLASLKDRTESELYIETANKINILRDYLPAKMSREEVENAVKEILANNVYSSFGLRMKAVMSKLKGKADNKLIKEVVESL